MGRWQDRWAWAVQPVPYNTSVIKRVDAFFQPTNYVRTVALATICLALLTVYDMPVLLVLFVLRIAGIAWQAVLVQHLPCHVGAAGLVLVAGSTLLVGLPYMIGTLYLWASPESVVRYCGVFALCLAMVDTICARRGDPVLFICDNVLIAISCLMFPVISWQTGQSNEEIVLIGVVAVTSFCFYLVGAADVMQTRGQLDVAQTAQSEGAKTQALGRLTGGVAHDFNNLLTVISGNLELMRHIDDPQERLTLLSEAATAAGRAAQVTSQLLAYSRRAPMQPTRVDVKTSIQELDMLLHRLLSVRIIFRTQIREPLPFLLVDKGQFEAVLLNLAINARDAMPRGGNIALRAMPEWVRRPVYQTSSGPLPPGLYLRIEVEDDGEGMTPEVLSRVFEPYFTTKPKGRGTGMGLSMAYGFAEQSGGLLMLQSAADLGSIATLMLPAHQKENAADTPAP